MNNSDEVVSVSRDGVTSAAVQRLQMLPGFVEPNP